MKLHLLYASHKPPHWAEEAVQEYVKRLPRHFQWKETRIQPTTPLAEARMFLEKLPEQAFLILLDIPGQLLSTEQFSAQLTSSFEMGKDIYFLIGGPNGVTDRIRARANMTWSLSPLTYPHAIARLVMIEQIYRAWTLAEGHPYHRA